MLRILEITNEEKKEKVKIPKMKKKDFFGRFPPKKPEKQPKIVYFSGFFRPAKKLKMKNFIFAISGEI